MNTDLARESLRGASSAWMQFGPCMLISELPDESHIDTSPYSSNQKIMALENVKIDAFVPSQQTISQVLHSEGISNHGINQKASLMSDTIELFPDWVPGLNGETVTCEDVTFKLSISLPILEGCLTATGDIWENGKSIISIDTGSASIAAMIAQQ
jgi:hypothetical protein